MSKAKHIILTSDVLVALQAMGDCCVDSCLSDVPYGLGAHQPTAEELIAYLSGADLDTRGDFMGHDWQVPSVRVWREIFRVLKPGAPLLIFGGSRTVDLIAVGMRAAGFEIRDQLLGWIQAQGMPKPATTTDKYLDAHLGAEREVIGTRVLTGNAAVSTAEKGGLHGAGPGHECTAHWIDWSIVGGESGPGARPFNPSWAKDIIAQCRAAGVACFVKQLGANVLDFSGRLKDRKGGDMAEWSEDLRVRQFPEVRP